MPAEQGVSADDVADADPDRAADQRIAPPYLDAVRPAVGAQFGQGAQERVGEPAWVAASPAATARMDPRMTVDRNPRNPPG
jgi:hypothetical protein